MSFMGLVLLGGSILGFKARVFLDADKMLMEDTCMMLLSVMEMRQEEKHGGKAGAGAKGREWQ